MGLSHNSYVVMCFLFVLFGGGGGTECFLTKYKQVIIYKVSGSTCVQYNLCTCNCMHFDESTPSILYKIHVTLSSQKVYKLISTD